ncbi:MAG: hypothetical protein II430_03220, partial [Selenomonas sp.]|nr:hypothetical protein [Selenomonas sp.]
MKKRSLIFLALALAFTALMSVPWLVPYMGWTVLVGLLPLLVMERLATESKVKHFWWWHYGSFVLWNAVTTWWVGEATVGGAIFAILANALQMSVVFGSFRWVKRRTAGVLPYLYLVAAWIAWERYYLTVAEISWPWLVLGNAFADTTGLVQWYSVLGTLGGSLWVWASNLSLFGLMVALSDGRMATWNAKARLAAFSGAILAVFGPMLWSACISFEEEGKPLEVVIGQPNYDPYEKFESLTQEQQDSLFEALLKQVMVDPDSADTRFRHSIHTITRTYGDSIAVRWAPDDYASWYVLNGCGYVIKRICYDDSGQDADTLAIVMPATLEEFEHFAQNDTLAAAAAQVLYGESTILNGAEVLPGSADELMMVYDDQQNIYGMAMMIAELRADIAQAMGLMYIDRDVKPGLQYYYVVSPNVHDSIYPVRAFMAGGKVNEPYKRETFPFAPVDSVIDETSILLKWPYTEHSAYDIERRRVSSDTINILRRDDNRWEKLNAFPYISFEQAGGDGRSDRIYVDTPRE